MSANDTKKNDVIRLNSGYDMPVVGFGTWKADPGVVATAVEDAITAGYRLIDAAAVYENEAEVGAGISRALAKSGGAVTRADLFITSKLWNTDHEPERVEAACRRTLADLGVDYLDLYLIHFPIAMPHAAPPEDGSARFADVAPSGARPRVPLIETWRALESLVSLGLVRSIGVSNYCAALVLDLLSAYASVRPSVLQIEVHPYLANSGLVSLCAREGIAVTAYSSLGSISYKSMPGFSFGGVPLLEREEVARIAGEAGRSRAQVLLRWAVQRGLAVIPKSTNAARIAENFDVLGWSLTEEQMAALNALNINERFNKYAETAWDAPIWS